MGNQRTISKPPPRLYPAVLMLAFSATVSAQQFVTFDTPDARANFG